MDTGPFDVRTVPLNRGIVHGQNQPPGPGDQRLDDLGQEASSDAVGPLVGGRDGGVTGAELAAELRGSNPGGDGPPAPSEDGAEGQWGKPRREPAVEGGSEPGEPLARGGCRMRGCHQGWLRSGFGSVVTAIVPVGPAPVFAAAARRREGRCHVAVPR